MKEIKKYKWELVFGLVILIVICGVVFLLYPTITSIFSTREEIQSTKEKNNLLLAKIEALNRLDLNTLENNYRLINFALLKDRKPNLVFSFFDDILSQNSSIDVSIGRIGFSPGEMKSKTTRDTKEKDNLTFDLPIKGKFDDIIAFIDLAEKNYPLVSIKSMGGEVADQTDIKTIFILHVYPELSILPSLEEPISSFSEQDGKLLDEINRKYTSSQSGSPVAPQKSNRTNLFE